MSLRIAQAIVAKDLRTEVRSRSAVSTVLPFAATMLLAFGFALGPDRLLLARTAPALLWLAPLFAAVVMWQRAHSHGRGKERRLRPVPSPPRDGPASRCQAGAGVVVCAARLG